MSNVNSTLPNFQFPLTYADLVCDQDLDPFAGETTSDLQNLIQDVTHVIVELPGSNPDDPNRGVGIFNYLSGTEADLAKVAGIIESQLTQDDRVQACSCSILTQDDATFPFVVRVDITVAGSVIGLSYGFSSVLGLVLQTP